MSGTIFYRPDVDSDAEYTVQCKDNSTSCIMDGAPLTCNFRLIVLPPALNLKQAHTLDLKKQKA